MIILNSIIKLKKIISAHKSSVVNYYIFKKNIKKYHNKHLGERCFIIGNGPSLNKEDLDFIKDEVSFASNKIYKIFSETTWRPKYYCIQDGPLLSNMSEEIMSPLNSSEKTFIRMSLQSKVSKKLKKTKKILYVPVVEPYYKENKVNFSYKVNNFIYDGWTVTYMAMQIAVYMGFKKIYLLGVDHSFPFEKKIDGSIVEVNGVDKAHFYETNEKDNKIKLHRSNFKEIVDLAYNEAERVSSESKKFKIYNSTKGGKLEIFERINLKEIDDETNKN